MEALKERLEDTTETTRRRTDAPGGPVWIRGDLPTEANMPLQEAFDKALKETQTYWHTPPAHAIPSVVLYCAHSASIEDIAGVVGKLKRSSPQAAIVVFGESASLPLARSALRAGARGALHAGMPPEQIARALSLAERGEVVLSRELLAAAGAEQRGPEMPALTQRQLQVLELVAVGFSNAQIARRLWLAESTVKQHLRATYKILGVSNRAQAAVVFRRRQPRRDNAEQFVENGRVSALKHAATYARGEESPVPTCDLPGSSSWTSTPRRRRSWREPRAG